MRISMILLAVNLAASTLAGESSQSSLAPRTFKPPRIAVVDISEVFENYQKKIDIEKRFEEEVKAAEEKLGNQQNERTKLEKELKNVQPGSDRHKDLTLRINELDYMLKNRQKELLKEFQEKQMAALTEIRDEIVTDIEKYAVGLDLDIVLEKQVAQGKMNAVRWPIVHYVKPELEITNDIIKRLNTQYTRPPSTSGGNSGSGKKGISAKP